MPGSRRTERPRVSRVQCSIRILWLALFITSVVTPRLSAEPTPTPGPTGTPCPPLLTENFDGVTAPNLPVGWTTTASGAEGPWVTSTAHPVSDPNSVFGPAVTNVGNTELISPMVAVPAAGGVLAFWNLFNLQPHPTNPTIGRDGMVLEISIDGGNFVDIVTAGGTFALGGYTHTIATQFMSPIAGRMAWSGLSAGSISSPQPIVSAVTLPAAAGGQNIQLKWRVATDDGIAVGAGVNIDDIVIVAAGCDVLPTPTPEASCPAVITQSSSQDITPGSFSCNGGPPNFLDLGNHYWRAFDMASVTGGQPFYVTSVSFGIEQAVTQSFQVVNVYLYRQTSGVFPGGTRTQIGFATLDLSSQKTPVFAGAPLETTVPAGTSQLIMEVTRTQGGGSGSFFIGSNAAPQTGPSYISAPTCGIPNPTDLSTIGHPDMHIVLNVRGYWFCPGGVTPTPTPSPTPTPTPTPETSCAPVITQSSSQAITPGSFSCNGGPPNFINLGNSYWRAFDMASVTGGEPFYVTAVSFGIERAVSQGFQLVDVHLYRQTSGVFPGGTRTLIGSAFLDLIDQKGVVVGWPLFATVPAGTSELIMEVSAPGGNSSSFIIGANAAPQTGQSYISAAACNLTNPTDLATIGFPDMHIVLNVHGYWFCPGGPTPTPTPTPTPGKITPTPTPTATPGGVTHAVNLSTRLLVGTGNDVGIGGFIITGTSPKQVLLRGIGPSLGSAGVPNPLADPFLELHDASGALIGFNDNWCTPPNDICDLIIGAGLPPMNDLESAILVTLEPGAYTAILGGNNNGTGVGLVEIYDLTQGSSSKLANISTRGFVGTGSDIVIAGFILGGGSSFDPIVIRGIGPSLTTFGVPNALADPTLELRDSSGTLLVANDNWKEAPFCKLVCAAGLGPPDSLESALEAALPPGAYTALLAGVGGGTGVGLVEVYDLGSQAPEPTPTPTPGNGTPTPPPPTPTPGTCTENFDGVTAPELPPGWMASNPIPGNGELWVTSTVVPDTPPNDAFILDQDGISDKVLDSRPILVHSAAAQLTFRNNFDTEFSDGVFCDGGVLEISAPKISNGEFLDFTDSRVGASCLSGCYNAERNCGDASGPIVGGVQWAGSSKGYIDTIIDLGPNLSGQTITLRWRFRSDEAVVAPGWRIDTLVITNASCP